MSMLKCEESFRYWYLRSLMDRCAFDLCTVYIPGLVRWSGELFVAWSHRSESGRWYVSTSKISTLNTKALSTDYTRTVPAGTPTVSELVQDSTRIMWRVYGRYRYIIYCVEYTEGMLWALVACFTQRRNVTKQSLYSLRVALQRSTQLHSFVNIQTIGKVRPRLQDLFSNSISVCVGWMWLFNPYVLAISNK